MEPEDTILEPGAGYGSLTRIIALTGSSVLAAEKDHRLAERLRITFRESPHVTVLEGDVLKLHLPNFDKIVGTPPYNISSKLVLKMLDWDFRVASIVFQEEFGKRMLAVPGKSNYGRLSVMTQSALRTELVEVIPSTAFQPRPKVNSVLLKVRKQPLQGHIKNGILFAWVVRELFIQRRRLVRSSLRHALEKRLGQAVASKLLEQVPLEDQRVFQLTPEDFRRLSQRLSDILEKEEIAQDALIGLQPFGGDQTVISDGE